MSPPVETNVVRFSRIIEGSNLGVQLVFKRSRRVSHCTRPIIGVSEQGTVVAGFAISFQAQRSSCDYFALVQVHGILAVSANCTYDSSHRYFGTNT